jgi:hypothetical protein
MAIRHAGHIIQVILPGSAFLSRFFAGNSEGGM